MEEVTIYLEGCDDTTQISLDVSAKELLFLEKISKMSKEISSYQCMPVLVIAEK